MNWLYLCSIACWGQQISAEDTVALPAFTEAEETFQSSVSLFSVSFCLWRGKLCSPAWTERAEGVRWHQRLDPSRILQVTSSDLQAPPATLWRRERRYPSEWSGAPTPPDSKEIISSQPESSDARILLVHVQRFFTFLLVGVGGRLPFVMLKYERTGLGRVKAHGRGLFVYFGL